jgi:hypothetical protein
MTATIHKAPRARAATFVAAAVLVLAALFLAACSSSGSVVPAGTVTPGPLESNGPISWSEASSRVGESLTVQGPVTSTGDDGAGDVVLNVGAPASDPSRLAVVIPKEALAKFPADPAAAYDGQLVTVTGLIEDRDGTATIVVTSRKDIKTGI